jgi:hypothetical protein
MMTCASPGDALLRTGPVCATSPRRAVGACLVAGAHGPVSADTDSGDITMSGASDALTARTSAGDITVTYP